MRPNHSTLGNKHGRQDRLAGALASHDSGEFCQRETVCVQEIKLDYLRLGFITRVGNDEVGDGSEGCQRRNALNSNK